MAQVVRLFCRMADVFKRILVQCHVVIDRPFYNCIKVILKGFNITFTMNGFGNSGVISKAPYRIIFNAVSDVVNEDKEQDWSQNHLLSGQPETSDHQ